MIKTTAIVLGWALLLCFTLNTPSLSEDSLPVPMDSIPRLPETFELIDFKDALANGVLMPDRFSLDSVRVQTGMTESALLARLPDSNRVIGTPQERTREQQWQFIRELLAKNNYSMHYYIMASIYYDRQLSGSFKTDQWTIDGVGKLTVYLHDDGKDGYLIWLLELEMEPISADQIEYKDKQANELVRSGSPEVIWNVRWNRVTVKTSE